MSNSGLDIESTYALIARLFDIRDLDDSAHAMELATGLVECGERGTWADVWWAYGAIHHDLSDEALEAAHMRLGAVDHPEDAQAAALMLTAEIEATMDIQNGKSPDPVRQVDLLSRARDLQPDWPAVHLRLAYPLRELERADDAKREARAALNLARRPIDSPTPVDVFFAGFGLDSGYLYDEARKFGEPSD